MNADDIVKDNMTIEEKLAAIDAAINDKDRQAEFNKRNGRPVDAPVDPAELTKCDGCE